MAASRCFRTFASSMSWWSHFLRYWTLLLNWWIFVQCTAVSDIEMETTHCASRCSFFPFIDLLHWFCFFLFNSRLLVQIFGKCANAWANFCIYTLGMSPEEAEEWLEEAGNASAILDMLLDEILLVWQPFRFQLVKYPSNLFVTSSFCADGAWHHDLLSHGGGGVHCCALNQWGSGVQAVSC